MQQVDNKDSSQFDRLCNLLFGISFAGITIALVFFAFLKYLLDLVDA